MSKLRPPGHNWAVGVAITVATVNLFWVANNLFRLDQEISNSVTQGGTGGLVDPSMIRLYLTIEVLLIITAFASLSRSLAGAVISIATLSWIVMEYVFWFVRTKNMLNAAGIQEIPPYVPHTASLYGAHGWGESLPFTRR